jgi:hypothetical protein
MWVSLSEIESVSLKAARNAGYGWSLADAAAGSARWLAMRGLPFLNPLAAGVLNQMTRLESFETARQIGSSFGPTHDGNRLGPISVLTAFDDDAIPLPTAGAEVSMRGLAAPVLVLPALARLSKRHGVPLLVRWPGVAAECVNGEVICEADGLAALNNTSADWLTVSRLTSGTLGQSASSLRHQGAEVGEAQWRALQALASRAYLPEGETARLRGAGAAYTDNE